MAYSEAARARTRRCWTPHFQRADFTTPAQRRSILSTMTAEGVLAPTVLADDVEDWRKMAASGNAPPPGPAFDVDPTGMYNGGAGGNIIPYAEAEKERHRPLHDLTSGGGDEKLVLPISLSQEACSMTSDVLEKYAQPCSEYVMDIPPTHWGWKFRILAYTEEEHAITNLKFSSDVTVSKTRGLEKKKLPVDMEKDFDLVDQGAAGRTTRSRSSSTSSRSRSARATARRRRRATPSRSAAASAWRTR